MYVFARSRDRVAKERGMRLRQLRGLLRRLNELTEMTFPACELLLKLGETRERHSAAWRLMDIELPEPSTARERKAPARFTYKPNRAKLRKARRREGRYLLRANMQEAKPAELWNFYIQLTGWKPRSEPSRTNSTSAPSTTISSPGSKPTSSDLPSRPR